MSGHRITDEERARLHDALDRAIDLANSRDPSDRGSQDALTSAVLNEIAGPLAGELILGRFVEGFEAARPRDGSSIEWHRDWFDDIGNVRAVRNGLAEWVQTVAPLLPSETAAQLSWALLALNDDEKVWLGRTLPRKGPGARRDTRKRFAHVFCVELEYLCGLHDWTDARAFYELTGNRPRRDGAIVAEQERTLGWPPCSALEHHTYTKHLRPNVPKPLLANARSAGEATRLGRELSADQAAFVRIRSMRLPKMESGGLDHLWRAAQEGAGDGRKQRL